MPMRSDNHISVLLYQSLAAFWPLIYFTYEHESVHMTSKWVQAHKELKINKVEEQQKGNKPCAGTAENGTAALVFQR